MQDYKIEVLVPTIDKLKELLQGACDNGAAGMFTLEKKSEGMKIVFEREYSEDAPFIEGRMAAGVPLKQALCDQLAQELTEYDPISLAPVLAALKSDAAVVRGMNTSQLIAHNEFAHTVLDHLPCSYTPVGGYFGGSQYCIGVPVRNVAAAFELGKAMGAEASNLGDVGFGTDGSMHLVVFRDTRVSQGPALG